jgi:hypothetical protein
MTWHDALATIGAQGEEVNSIDDSSGYANDRLHVTKKFSDRFRHLTILICERSIGAEQLRFTIIKAIKAETE